MFWVVISLLFFFYFFPEIKIFSYSVASFLPFLIFAFLLPNKNFREIMISNKKITIIWLTFLLINVISTIFSPYKYLAIQGLGKMLSFSLLFWIMFQFLKEDNWQNFLNFLIIILIFSVLLNTLLFFYPELIYTYLNKLYIHRLAFPRLSYPFLHPNSFSSFLIIVLIIILFHQSFSKYYLILYFLVSLGIVLAGSKAGFVFYLFFSLISLFFKKDFKEKIPLVLIMLITSLIFINIWLPIKENKLLSKILHNIYEGEKFSYVKKLYTLETYEKKTVRKRIEIWNNAVFYIIQRPLIGYGPMVQRYKLTKALAHNLFFDFLLNYGIIGFLFLLYLIKEIAKKLFLVKKPIYIFFFLYILLYSFIESVFFNGIMEIILFSFLVKLKNEEIFNNNNHT